MVDRNDSFMREVNDAIRQEQLMKLWERFGIIAIVGLVALFVGIGVYKWKESSRISSEIKAGESYEAASRLASDGKTDDALKAFDNLAKSGPSGYAALARLRLAAAHAKENRIAEAIAANEAISADSGVDQLLRDFATLQSAVLRLDQADWTEMKKRL
ncbi:MAG: tetratricopeptide repeat protein, partial [Hyphomicrobiaceae bacterium]